MNSRYVQPQVNSKFFLIEKLLEICTIKICLILYLTLKKGLKTENKNEIKQE